MRRRLRVAGAVLAVAFAVLTLALPGVVESSRQSFDPTTCDEFELTVLEYAREPSELDYDEEDTARYENLTSDQQALFDRGFQRRDEFVSVSQATFQRVREMPSLVAYRGAVYDVGVRVDQCPVIAGVPVAMNPVIEFFLSLNEVVTGPLAPLIVVGGGVALAFRLGRMLEY